MNEKTKALGAGVTGMVPSAENTSSVVERAQHPRQEPLPIPGLAPQPPVWPETRQDYLAWSRRPDPAVFARYVLEQLLQHAKEVARWAERHRPPKGWAIVENAPGLNPVELIVEHITAASNLLSALAADAQCVWRDEAVGHREDAAKEQAR